MFNRKNFKNRDFLTMSYSASQLAIEFQVSDKHVRRLAAQHNIGSKDVRGIWSFTDHDKFALKAILSGEPVPDEFSQGLAEIEAMLSGDSDDLPVLDTKPMGLARVDQSGDITRTNGNIQDLSIRDAISILRKMNENADQDILNMRLLDQDMRMQHAEEMAELEQEIKKQEEKMLAQRQVKRAVEKTEAELQAEKSKALETLRNLAKLGVKLKKS